MTTTPRRWIAQSIADHANFYGDKIAVRDETAELSYRTLIGRAAALSRAIEDLQIPDLPIGIFLPNVASYLVAIVALLLAGRTSVPLDTAHPDERNCRIIGRAPLGAAIVDATTAASMHRMAPSLQLIDVAAGAMNAAPPLIAAPVPKRIFMISFTSGTTDLPKGVCITEQSLSARLVYAARESSLRPDDRLPLLQSMSGAASVKFALDALLQGAQIGIFDLKRLGLTATRDLLGTLRPPFTCWRRAPSGLCSVRTTTIPGVWRKTFAGSGLVTSEFCLLTSRCTDVALPRRAGWSFQSARRKPAPMRRGRSTTLRPSSGHWFPSDAL